MRNKKYDSLIKINKEYFDTMFNGIDSHIRLDNEQRKAIVSNAQRLMIIAGAGSGKTTTLTAKVKYLIDKGFAKPTEILLLSFTNKAVMELKERINIEFGIDVKIKTFHSLGYEIVKMVNKEVKIIANSEDLLKSIIKRNIDLNIKRTFKELFLKNKFEEVCITFIKLLKTKDYDVIDLEKIKEIHKGTLLIVKFLDFIFLIFNEYQEELKKNNYVDYDDLILLKNFTL